MHTTFIQNTKGLDATRGFKSLGQVNNISVFKKLLVQMQHQVLAMVQAPARMPKDIRDEMYW